MLMKPFLSPLTLTMFSDFNYSSVGIAYNSPLNFFQISFGVFAIYLKSCGVLMSVVTIVFYIIYVATQVGTNIWLSEWSNDQPEPDGTQDTALRDLRLGVYGGLGGGQGKFNHSWSQLCKI